MSKKMLFKLSSVLTSICNPQIYRLVLFVILLLVSLFAPQMVYAGPSGGGVGS